MGMRSGEVHWSDEEISSYVPLPGHLLERVYSERPSLLEEGPKARLSYLLGNSDYPASEIFGIINNDEAHRALMELERIALDGKNGEEPARKKMERIVPEQPPLKDYISLESPIVEEFYRLNGLDTFRKKYSFLSKMVQPGRWGSWAEGSSKWEKYSSRAVAVKISRGDKDLAFILMEQIAEIEIGAQMIIEVLDKGKK